MPDIHTGITTNYSMNYKYIYANIIINAKKEMKLGLRRKKNGNYYEWHHIFPKSLFPEMKGERGNRVLLTGVEHFKCHQLLLKIYPGSEMAYAIHAFTSRPNCNYNITATEYEEIKKLHAETLSKRNKGKKQTPEQIKKCLETKEKNGTLHRKRSEEQKRRYAETIKQKYANGYINPNKGKKRPGWSNSTSWKKGNIPWNKEKKLPEFSKQRIGSGNPMYGRKWYTNGKVNIVADECPEGFIPGIDYSLMNINEEKEKIRREKIRKASTGKHWYNNGENNKFCVECPEGYVPGFLTPRIYTKKEK